MVPRRVPVPVLRPPLQLCKPTGVDLGPGTRIVLAADRGGVGEALAKRLRKLKVEVLSLDPSAERSDVEGQLDGWLSTGAVQGVYWLPALDDEGPVADMDADTWHDALQARVKNLAATMKRLYDNGPFLVVGTRLGGRHGYEPDGALCPLGGAVTGFTKAYKREKPEVLVKAVDFPASRKSAALADRLVEETLADPGCVEVGGDAQRLTIGLEEQPAADGNPAFDLHGGSIYVVTGAAGSIVNAITADLATHGGGGIFHLLDLTPTPDEGDADLRALRRRPGRPQERADRAGEGSRAEGHPGRDREGAGPDRAAGDGPVRHRGGPQRRRRSALPQREPHRPRRRRRRRRGDRRCARPHRRAHPRRRPGNQPQARRQGTA